MSTNMQEVRLTLCHRSSSSQGARDFLVKNYQQIKRLNPKLPFLVRHGTDIEPQLVAVYDYGGEANRDISYMNEAEVKEKMRELVEIGEVALKANLYPWQQSSPTDEDVVDYDRHDPHQHHV